jgi:hypothetical protein
MKNIIGIALVFFSAGLGFVVGWNCSKEPAHIKGNLKIERDSEFTSAIVSWEKEEWTQFPRWSVPDGYHLYITEISSRQKRTVLGANTTWCSVSLKRGSSYEVQATAFNDYGESDRTPIVRFGPPILNIEIQ